MITVVYVANEKIVDQLLVSIISMEKYNYINVKIFYTEISKKTQEFIKEIVQSKVEFFNLSDKLHKLNNNWVNNVHVQVTLETFYRLLIIEYITEEKVLVIDCDTLVLGKLDSLFDINLDNSYLAASPKPESFGESYNTKIGLREGIKYFNSGVMLLNVNLIRRDNLFSKMIDFLSENYENLHIADQDVINILVDGKYSEISSIYNYTQGKLGKIADKIKIIHYVGKFKPKYKFIPKLFLKEYKNHYSQLYPRYKREIQIKIIYNFYFSFVKQMIKNIIKSILPKSIVKKFQKW